MERHGSIWFGTVWRNALIFLRFGSEWFGSIRYVFVRFGLVRFVLVRFGAVHLLNVYCTLRFIVVRIYFLKVPIVVPIRTREYHNTTR